MKCPKCGHEGKQLGSLHYEGRVTNEFTCDNEHIFQEQISSDEYYRRIEAELRDG